MRVTAPMSLDQELLVEAHLIDGDELYVAPGEKKRLISWVQWNHPGHTISAAEMDLENTKWLLDLVSVTVTS